jgi:NDP-sugar pyrophosphorylase family protein
LKERLVDSNRHAVILAGGKGTRLAPYTTVLPKPLLPIGEAPILDVVMQQLAGYGFGNVTLAVGYLAHLIEAVFGDGSRHGVRPSPWERSDRWLRFRASTPRS